MNKKELFKINNFKEIFNIVFSIFMQMIFTIFSSQIIVLILSWNSIDLQTISNKVKVLYSTISIIPTMISAGIIIVASKEHSNNNIKNTNSVIFSGMLLNFIITGIILLFSIIFADFFLRKIGVTDNVIFLNKTYQTTEIEFAKKYWIIMSISILLISCAETLIAGLQVFKNNKIIFLSIIVSNFSGSILILFILYIFKINPVFVSFVFIFIYIIQIIILFSWYYNKVIKTNNIELIINNYFKFEYFLKSIKFGTVFILKTGVWYFCYFYTFSLIVQILEKNSETKTAIINLDRAINNIALYPVAFMQATSIATSILIAKEIKVDNEDKIYKTGNNCIKFAIYGQIIISIILMILTVPLLYLYRIDTSVIKYGIILNSILSIKLIFDVINSTILRNLWALDDLVTTLIFMLSTTILSMVVLPYIVSFYYVGNTIWGLVIIYLCATLDPFLRSLFYSYRWYFKKWIKKYKIKKNKAQ